MHIEVVDVLGCPPDVRELLYGVMYREWGVAPEQNWLHEEHGGQLILMRDENQNDSLLGMVRLMGRDVTNPTARQIRQVVMAQEARGKGIGRTLVSEAERLAKAEGAHSTWLQSRHLAYEFYERLGYVASGEEFLSEMTKIPHRYMEKVL